MDDTLKAQLDQWHANDAYDKIIAALTALPAAKQTDETHGLLARAYNNLDRHADAIEALERVSADGQTSERWMYFMGFACYFTGLEAHAITLLKQSAALGDDSAKFFLDYYKEEIAQIEAKLAGKTAPESDGDFPEYLSGYKSDDWVSVVLSITHPKLLAIAVKIDAIRPETIMGPDNWAALLHRFLMLNHSAILEGMNTDFDEGDYTAYYPISDENMDSAFALIRVIEFLIENEDVIYKFIEAENEHIKWSE